MFTYYTLTCTYTPTHHSAQFPRNDLYLFELLQNAVDDGASIVSFATTRDGLEFTHNGKRFTALDVLGLASVGLSTKGSDGKGPKRTIGFMGVGFKAGKLRNHLSFTNFQ